MNTINKAIGHYQEIIGTFDKNPWERSVDQAVNKTLNNITRKRAKVNKDFIDVDIVRGSAFSKSKQRQNIVSISIRAFCRVVFLPFYRKWWQVVGGKFHSQIIASAPHHPPSSTNHLSSSNILDACQRDEHDESFLQSRSAREVGGESGRESSGSHDTGIDLSQNDNIGVSDSNADVRGPQNLAVPDSISEESSTPEDENVNLVTHLNSTEIKTGSVDASVACDLLPAYSRSRSPLKSTVQSQNKIKYIRRTKAWLQEVSRESTPVNSFFGSSTVLQCPQRFASHDRILVRSISTPTNCKNGRRTASESSFDDQNMTTTGHFSTLDRSGTSNSSLNSRDVQDESMSNLEDFSNLVSLSQVRHSEPEMSSDSSFDEYVREEESPRSPKIGAGSNSTLRRRKNSKFDDMKLSKPLLQRELNRSNNNKDVTKTNNVTKKSNSNIDESKVGKKRLVEKYGEKMNDADEEDDVAEPKQRSRILKKVCFEENEANNLITVTPYESASELSINEEESNTGAQNIEMHKASKIVKNLSSCSTKIGCMIWEDNELQKVQLTVLDVGWSIIKKVEKSSMSCEYFLIGIFFSLMLALTPLTFQLYHQWDQMQTILAEPTNITNLSHVITHFIACDYWHLYIALNGSIQRFGLSCIIFFLLSVSERTFYQRLLYAKNFFCLTSYRRARKYDLPHFRLNKVSNIKMWLLLRSFLKKRGPQRSVEILVSFAFLASVVIVSMICIEMLQDHGSFLDGQGNWELIVWGLAIGIYLLRFITLGTRINKKYRNFSVLITEKINLCLHMEQKPHKKNELQLANNVLKLAEDLLKEVESPFKVSGMAANPLLYNIIRVFVLSAFSAVLTELLGFKLKLYKIK